jgi:hypothetical protein
MSEKIKCAYHNSDKIFCEKEKVNDFCKTHKYLEGKVDLSNLLFCIH